MIGGEKKKKTVRKRRNTRRKGLAQKRTLSTRRRPVKARKEVSAGGIVFKRTPKGVRVALILDPFKKWAFAKGHVEKGETIEQAAVRETREEMGLDNVTVMKPLGKIHFWFRDRYREESRGMLIHKDVHYFLMEAPAEARGKPQKKEKIRKIIWVPLSRVERQSSYTDVSPIVKEALEYFPEYRQKKVKRYTKKKRVKKKRVGRSDTIAKSKL